MSIMVFRKQASGTSTGFDSLGFPVRYSSLEDAGIAYSEDSSYSYSSESSVVSSGASSSTPSGGGGGRTIVFRTTRQNEDTGDSEAVVCEFAETSQTTTVDGNPWPVYEGTMYVGASNWGTYRLYAGYDSDYNEMYFWGINVVVGSSAPFCDWFCYFPDGELLDIYDNMEFELGDAGADFASSGTLSVTGA